MWFGVFPVAVRPLWQLTQVADHLDVIDAYDSCEGHRVMAGLAAVRRGDVGVVLARSADAIVANSRTTA